MQPWKVLNASCSVNGGSGITGENFAAQEAARPEYFLGYGYYMMTAFYGRNHPQ